MNKKREKEQKKKLGSLILLLFLTVIMLATSTYAWFTANKTVSISDINVYVSASSGLQISTDALNWKTLIANEDITTGYNVDNGAGVYLQDKNMLPTTLAPVSTSGGTTTGYMNMYLGTVEANSGSGDFELTATQLTESKGNTGHFVAFDIFLKTDSPENLYLGVGSGVVKNAGAPLPADGLQYAGRIGLVTNGTVLATSTQYQMVNQFGNTEVKIIEPNYDGHTAYGITQANLYYQTYKVNGADYPWTAPNNLTAGATGNPYMSYDGVKAVISTPIVLEETNATDNNAYFETVTGAQKLYPVSTDFTAADPSVTNNQLLYTTFPAGVTKLRVYMWIEGQDVDCENNASGVNLTFRLSFTQNASNT